MNDFLDSLDKDGVLDYESSKNLKESLKKGVELSLLEKRIAELSELKEEETTDLRSKIADMTTAEKIKMAMLGDAVTRGLLVLDTNRLVQQAALNNPRLQANEVEAWAKNANLSEFVLRSIANDRTWMKGYAVKYNLICNPKTPQDVGLKWLRFINKKDLRVLAKSKNIPQLIAITARKRLSEMDKK